MWINGLTHFYQCFSWARLGLDKAQFWANPFFTLFLLSWTWARFGLTHFFQCFSWARFGLDQALFWANPFFYQCVCLFGLGLWRLLCCAHVLRMRLCAAVSELRLRRLGLLTTNVIVGMIEVGTFVFEAVEEKPYDLQLLFW